MGVDMEIVLGYGYLVSCDEFEALLEEIQETLRKRFRQEQKLVQTKFKSKKRKQHGEEERPFIKRSKTDTKKSSQQDEKEDKHLELVIPTTHYPGPKWYGLADHDNVMNDLHECWKLGFMEQDGYGNKDGDASVFIYWQEGQEKAETIMHYRKVGLTPFSFLRDQIYTDSDDIIGGARKYFAVAVDSDYSGFQDLESKKAAETKTKIDRWFESGGLDDKSECKGEDVDVGGADRDYDGKEPKETGPCLLYQELGQVLKTKYAKKFRKWLVSRYG